MGDPVAWCVLPFTVKERPDLESKFDERVQTAVKYARRIEDFNELIDPRTFLVTV